MTCSGALAGGWSGNTYVLISQTAGTVSATGVAYTTKSGATSTVSLSFKGLAVGSNYYLYRNLPGAPAPGVAPAAAPAT